MSPARVIVCERATKWAVALRRGLLGEHLSVLETRSLHGCLQAVTSNPASFVMLECLPANLEEVVRCVKQLNTSFPRARVAVFCHPELETGQWVLREAGAVHVVFSPRDLEPLMRILRRHMASVQTVGCSDRQRIWQQLPWSGDENADPDRLDP